MAYITKDLVRLAQRQRELREAQQGLFWARMTGDRPLMQAWAHMVTVRLDRCWSYQSEADKVQRQRLPQNIFLPAVNGP